MRSISYEVRTVEVPRRRAILKSAIDDQIGSAGGELGMGWRQCDETKHHHSDRKHNSACAPL